MRVDEVAEELGVSVPYDRVKKVYGSGRIAETVQAVIRQEQAQRSRKRTASRDAR